MQQQRNALAEQLASTTRWMGQMILAAILAMALLITSAIGAIAALLALLEKLAADALKLAGTTLVRSIVYLVCVASPVASIAWALPRLHNAFGGDGAALLAAVPLALYPPAVVLAMSWGLGGLFLSGLVILALGATLPVLPAFVRVLCVTGIIASVVTFSLMKGKSNEQQIEQHDTVGDCASSTPVHGLPVNPPDPVHPTR